MAHTGFPQLNACPYNRNRWFSVAFHAIRQIWQGFAIPQTFTLDFDATQKALLKTFRESYAARQSPTQKFLFGKPKMWIQRTFQLSPRKRGFHLITKEVLAAAGDLSPFQIGILHLFIQHTSASLTLNENADPDVRQDMEMAMSKVAPESWPYIHTLEGPDDMPAHIKASMMGSSVSVPIRSGKLLLGTWQGIYLGEHRDHGGPRTLVVTVQGE